jgi:hypothetical protein
MDRTFAPTKLPLIPRMHALALKKIFDKLNAYEEKELEMGIDGHMQILAHVTPNDREILHRIVDALRADEELDYFSKQKWQCKTLGIKYWKLYSNGLPYLNIYRNYADAG